MTTKNADVFLCFWNRGSNVTCQWRHKNSYNVYIVISDPTAISLYSYQEASLVIKYGSDFCCLTIVLHWHWTNYKNDWSSVFPSARGSVNSITQFQQYILLTTGHQLIEQHSKMISQVRNIMKKLPNVAVQLNKNVFSRQLNSLQLRSCGLREVDKLNINLKLLRQTPKGCRYFVDHCGYFSRELHNRVQTHSHVISIQLKISYHIWKTGIGQTMHFHCFQHQIRASKARQFLLFQCGLQTAPEYH